MLQAVRALSTTKGKGGIVLTLEVISAIAGGFCFGVVAGVIYVCRKMERIERMTDEELFRPPRQKVERPEWLIKVLQQARADLAKAASWIIDVERHERIQTAVQRVADAMRDNELLTERVVHPLIFALEREIERQDEKHGRYEGTMLGRSRLALGTLEDEVAEALKAWRDERAATHWEATRAEVLQVAAVAIRTLRDAL